MSGRAPDFLLPSISQLLKRVGALEGSPNIDIAAVARQPVFREESWRRAIAEFLRWSGSTHDVAGGASVYELLLCHGRAGVLALFRAFREYLLDHGGPFKEAEARLESLRTVVNMAGNWLHQIDWDLDEAEGIKPEDFGARSKERLTVELPAALSNRLRNAVYWTPGLAPLSDFVERTLEERIAELEEDGGGPIPPRMGEGARVEVRHGSPEPPPRTVKSLWKKSVEERASPSAPSPDRPRPPQKQY